MYFRVSTDEQAKSGYSIPDQRRTLRERAASEGWTVVDEIVDDGYSGATIDRPGLRSIYELAEAREIDAVIATKRDRFFRSRLYRLEMDRDMKDHGVTLVSLTDTGNLIGDSVMDSFAEYEHQVIRDRTANGKIQKARAGKVVGGHTRAYGFDWTKDHDGKTAGYSVNEPEMSVVRRIFSEVAGGDGIRTVKGRLDAERVPRPGSGKTWSRPFLRAMLLDDLYRPHTLEELKGVGVSEDVTKALDTDSVYGVYRYQNVPVPVPDASNSLETVLRARRRVESNTATPSKNAHRFWELSGGILFCGECGRRMQTHSPHAAAGYFYYRCQNRQNGKADRCIMSVMVRTDSIEPKVWNEVRGLVDDKELLLSRADESFAAKRRELSYPNVDAASVVRDLSKIEEARANYQRAFAADAMSLKDLKARTTELDAERDVLRERLERAGRREEELEDLEGAQRALEERIREGYDDIDSNTPKERREIYIDLNLRVDVGLDKVPRISGTFPVDFSGMKGRLWKRPEGHAQFITSESPGHESHEIIRPRAEHVGSWETSSSARSTPRTPPRRLTASSTSSRPTSSTR